MVIRWSHVPTPELASEREIEQWMNNDAMVSALEDELESGEQDAQAVFHVTRATLEAIANELRLEMMDYPVVIPPWLGILWIRVQRLLREQGWTSRS